MTWWNIYMVMLLSVLRFQNKDELQQQCLKLCLISKPKDFILFYFRYFFFGWRQEWSKVLFCPSTLEWANTDWKLRITHNITARCWLEMTNGVFTQVKVYFVLADPTLQLRAKNMFHFQHVPQMLRFSRHLMMEHVQQGVLTAGYNIFFLLSSQTFRCSGGMFASILRSCPLCLQTGRNFQPATELAELF